MLAAPRKNSSRRVFMLELQVEAELNDPTPAAAQNLAGIGERVAAVTRVGDGGVRIAQVEMVEGVQEVASECQLHSFPHAEALHGAHVPVPVTRAEDHVARR